MFIINWTLILIYNELKIKKLTKYEFYSNICIDYKMGKWNECMTVFIINKRIFHNVFLLLYWIIFSVEDKKILKT